MIYRLTIISNEEEDFVAEIQIDPYDTFLTLHEKMLELCGFEDNQPTSFTVCTPNWKKLQTITLLETDTAADEDAYVMEDTALNDFLEDEKQQPSIPSTLRQDDTSTSNSPKSSRASRCEERR